MAETVSGLRIEVKITGTVAGDNGSRLAVDESYIVDFQDGTGANQIGNVYNQTRTLAATNETIDLDGTTDFQGASTSTWNTVKFLYFRNNSTTTSDVLTIGGGDFSTPFNDPTDKVKVGPNGILLLVSPTDGYAITASTGDGLLVATSYTGTYKAILGVDNS